MKNLLMLIAFGLITFVFLGVFTVNESENAIIVSKKQHKVYYRDPGLYFAVPIYNTVNLIYMGNREALVSFELNSESGNTYVKSDMRSEDKSVVIDLIVNWHVINSSDYFNNLQKLGQVDFNKNLVDNILTLLLQKINGKDITTLNQLNDVINSNIDIKSMGITFDHISIVSVNYALSNSVTNIKLESQLSNMGDLSVQNKIIESAYYQAQRIKTEAQINQANKYDQIKKENPKFYNYFRLIDVYKTSAKDKLDVPAFDKLYH